MLTWTSRALAILGCTLVAVPTLAAEKTFDRSFTAPPGGELTFNADEGSVTIVGHDSRELTIHAQMKGSSDFLDGVTVSAEQSGTGVTVTEHSSHHTFSSWFDWFGGGYHRVSFTIDVPRDYPVDLHTGGGSIEVSHLKAALRGRTAGGSLEINDVAGPVNARTAGGSIDASQINGAAELRSAGGSITVANCTGDLDVETGGGGIDLDNIDGKVRAMTGGGGVRATMRTNHGITLRSGGGGITLLLPTSVHATVEAHSGGGHATSAIPLTTVETEEDDHHDLRGTINGGGDPIELSTGGGGIRIDAL